MIADPVAAFILIRSARSGPADAVGPVGPAGYADAVPIRVQIAANAGSIANTASGKTPLAGPSRKCAHRTDGQHRHHCQNADPYFLHMFAPTVVSYAVFSFLIRMWEAFPFNSEKFFESGRLDLSRSMPPAKSARTNPSGRCVSIWRTGQRTALFTAAYQRSAGLPPPDGRYRPLRDGWLRSHPRTWRRGPPAGRRSPGSPSPAGRQCPGPSGPPASGR